MSKEFIWDDNLLFEWGMYVNDNIRTASGSDLPMLLNYFKQSKQKEETKSNDSFQWDEKLSGEYIGLLERELFKNGMLPESFRKNFVESHTPKPQAENWFSFKDGKITLPKEQAEELRQSPLNADNRPQAENKPDLKHSTNTYSDGSPVSETRAVKPDRDWRIVQMKKKSGFGIINEAGLIDEKYFELKDWDITAVERISDSVTFSVGDEVEYRSGDEIGWRKYWDGRIEKIQVCFGKKDQVEFKIVKEGEDDVHKFIYNIRHSQKLSPQPHKEEQRIEVEMFSENNIWERGREPEHSFRTKKEIPTNKFPLIKQAIEQVLNDDPTMDFLCKVWDEFILEKLQHEQLKQKVDDLCNKSFQAGSEIFYTHIKNGFTINPKYPTYQDYQNSIK